MSVIDAAAAYLADDGLVGVADFFTSARHDNPNRQHSAIKRWFWRLVFERANMDLSHQRRSYLDYVFEPVYEYNGVGKNPYIPFFHAPYYQWVGRPRNVSCLTIERFPARASDDLECKRPPTFPPTFLYSLSWEDPREDDRVLEISSDDVVLTLTSGGCNALDLVLQGAKQVVAVDMNPAQSYLLELKRVATMRLPFEDVWQMFGDGVHPKFPQLLERELSPFLSGMGRLIRAVRFLAKVTRQEKWIDNIVNAPTLSKQADVWSATVGRWLRQAGIGARIFSFFFTNRLVLWFCAGVCKGQLNLIRKEDNIYSYIVRSLNYVATESHLRDSNYFYRCCLTGRFARHCCPRFLEEPCFNKLKVELASQECLLIRTGSFVSELKKRLYSKVILMDHVDWLEQHDIEELANALQKHVKVGGRIIWRSASRKPHYSQAFEKAGFKVIRIRSSETYMDRVSMYASFYVGIRQDS
ncbi:hypothetical protein CBR_g36906 [Chara braunii]|uniref:DUF3419 domain-containing protein n=1 Tax=Chara braunii TaxID=69332 RepID=A0A388JZD4_CHABU|nr:hypothetical protein CBR_g36906 [Chara braunii]|eukprot:GBG63137.1 hypothetical protein CBR_g36906 [Chara braunii]